MMKKKETPSELTTATPLKIIIHHDVIIAIKLYP
jgi:hypothetical protein